MKEISVFLPNNPGVLAKFIALLNDSNIIIKALTVAETPEYGLLLILVDKPNECIDLLEKNDYNINATEVLALKMPNDMDALFDIANILGRNNVNIEYLYMTVVGNSNLIIVRVNDNKKAVKVLKENHFILADIEEL